MFWLFIVHKIFLGLPIWNETLKVGVLCYLWTEQSTFITSLFFLVGNDVSLFESQQLDECNNNVQDDDDNVVVVLPSAPHSKTSSNSSSPSPSLRSSPSSSPLSPSSTSTTSSSSDGVSLQLNLKQLCWAAVFDEWKWREYMVIHLLFFVRTLMARHARRPSSRLAGAPVPTGKSLLLSVITEHRATISALHLEATREERCVRHYCIRRPAAHWIEPSSVKGTLLRLKEIEIIYPLLADNPFNVLNTWGKSCLESSIFMF